MLKNIYNHLGFRITYSFWETRKMRKRISKNGLQALSKLDVSQYKTSDTLYILGSGISIMDLTQEEWASISSHDSIGFNSWMHHPFVPTYYCMETPMKSEHFDLNIAALNRKKEEYSQVPFIIQYQHYLKSPNTFERLELPKENYYWNAPLMPYTTNERLLNRVLNWWKNKHELNMSWVLHYAGSISYLISMGYLMGYKKIVLLGIDLNNSDYFFHHPQASQEAKEYAKIHDELLGQSEESSTSKAHQTTDKKFTSTYGCLPIDDYIYKFQKILNDLDIELEIGNTSSKLYPKLPLHTF